MRLTPLDIYQQEFKKVFRGLNPEEVEEFLERIADDYEQLIKENADLNELVESLKTQLSKGGNTSQLDDLTAMAREDADNIIQEARKEADNIIRKARAEAQEIKLIVERTQTEEKSLTEKKAPEAPVEAADSLLEEAKEKASIILEKAKKDELELRREISRLQSQKERFLIEYRELLERYLKIVTGDE